jgi:hypothetical protein
VLRSEASCFLSRTSSPHDFKQSTLTISLEFSRTCWVFNTTSYNTTSYNTTGYYTTCYYTSSNPILKPCDKSLKARINFRPKLDNDIAK